MTVKQLSPKEITQLEWYLKDLMFTSQHVEEVHRIPVCRRWEKETKAVSQGSGKYFRAQISVPCLNLTLRWTISSTVTGRSWKKLQHWRVLQYQHIGEYLQFSRCLFLQLLVPPPLPSDLTLRSFWSVMCTFTSSDYLHISALVNSNLCHSPVQSGPVPPPASATGVSPSLWHWTKSVTDLKKQLGNTVLEEHNPPSSHLVMGPPSADASRAV